MTPRRRIRYEDLELHVPPEPVRPEPVRRVADDGRPGCVFVWIAIALVAWIVIGIALLSDAAPRSGPAVPPRPALSGAPLAIDDAPTPTPRPHATYGQPVEGTPVPYVEGEVGLLVTGTATWYCGHGSPCTRGYDPSDRVAAIDRSTGLRRGDRVIVRHDDRAVVVTIVDVCACRGRRVIDLTTGAFRVLAPLSRGVIAVELETVPRIRLPDTDMETP